MGHAINLGRDPRTVTEDIVRHLRNAFLSLMAPELVVLPRDRLDTIAAQAQQLGAAALVRAIERLGSALVDMRHAPDPRILVEVALVQLTHDESGTDTDALMARIERLEQSVKQLRAAGPGSSASSRISTERPDHRACRARRSRQAPHPCCATHRRRSSRGRAACDRRRNDTGAPAAPVAAEPSTPTADDVHDPVDDVHDPVADSPTSYHDVGHRRLGNDGQVEGQTARAGALLGGFVPRQHGRHLAVRRAERSPRRQVQRASRRRSRQRCRRRSADRSRSSSW